jgi:hypothetical protein
VVGGWVQRLVVGGWVQRLVVGGWVVSGCGRRLGSAVGGRLLGGRRRGTRQREGADGGQEQLKLQLIQLATTEVAGDNLSDTEEDEDEEATTYAFDLPFEGSSRSAAFTTMLANAQSKVDELKDCLSSAEVLRVTAMCKLQSARERTSVASENTSSPASGATAAATSD